MYDKLYLYYSVLNFLYIAKIIWKWTAINYENHQHHLFMEALLINVVYKFIGYLCFSY